MNQDKLKAAILVISDTAAKDSTTDKSGAILQDTFAADGGDRWAKPTINIVPDHPPEIQNSIRRWTDTEENFNLIVTTGGTGFAVRDCTPEVRPVHVEPSELLRTNEGGFCTQCALIKSIWGFYPYR